MIFEGFAAPVHRFLTPPALIYCVKEFCHESCALFCEMIYVGNGTAVVGNQVAAAGEMLVRGDL